MTNLSPEAEKILLILDTARTEVIVRREAPKSRMDARIKAIEQTTGQILCYINEYYDLKIIERICRKKVDAIMEAQTVAELDEIVHSPKPIQYGGEIIDHPKYHFDEEELLNWGRASLHNVPSLAVEKRINILFERVYGMPLDEYCKQKTP